MDEKPTDASPPPIEYSPEADPGHIYIERSGARMLVVVPPLGWQGFRLPTVGLAVLAVVWLPVTWWAIHGLAIPVFAAAIAGAIWLVMVYVLGYAWHLARRRVRIDIDDLNIHREFISPFGRWRRTWKVRDVEAVLTTLETSDETDFLFHYLYLFDRRGYHHVLLDSPDEEQVASAANAVRDLLGLTPPGTQQQQQA